MNKFLTAFLGVSMWGGMLSLATLAAAEESADELLQRASDAALRDKSEEAVRLVTLAIKQNPDRASAYYLRGREHFRVGKIAESVADFDKYVELKPDQESRQWERGISLYYAKQFDRGAKQFELYQTFHDSDVENSVWRFLCMAPTTGIEQARSVMLPIKNDPRVPMMQIYEMYRGQKTPEEVLAAAHAGDPKPPQLAGRMFYAQLYIGLYHEAAGKQELAKKYICQASDDHKNTTTVNHYMWDVARIHADRLRARP